MLTATGDLADSLVESDGSGNITASVTGNLTGNVTGDVVATDITTDTLTATTTNGDLAISRNGTGEITIDTIPIYGLVILDETTSLVSTTSTVGSWTNVSTSAPAGAKMAIIRCIALLTDTLGSGSGNSQAILYVKSNASTSGADATTTASIAEHGTDGITTPTSELMADYNDIHVNLNSSGQFQYQTSVNVKSGMTGTLQIRLVGYYV